MIVNDNGVDREATPDEVAAWEQAQAETETFNKKIEALQKKKAKVLEKLGLTNDELLALLS